MAVTTFAGNTTGILWLGQFGTGTVSSEAYRNRVGNSSQLNAGWTGTQLEVRVWGTASYKFLVSIDGGAFTEYTTSAGYAWYTVATGLSDTAHSVVVKAFTSTGFLYISDVSTLRVTGAAPAVGYATGMGAYTVVGSSYLKQGGDANTGAANGYSSGAHVQWTSGGAIYFSANCTDLWIWAWGVGRFALVQDGVLLGTTAGSGTSFYELYHVGTGLSGTHDYQIVNVYNNGATQLGYANGVVVGGGTGIVASTPTTRGELVQWGDSIAVEQNFITNGADGQAFQTAIALGFIPHKHALSGQKWSWAATNYTMAYGTYQHPGVVFVLFGTNEALAGDSTVTMVSNMTTALNALLALLDSEALVFVKGILPSSNSTISANRSTYNTALQNGVAAIGDARLHWVNTDGVIVPATDTDDGVHPNATGYGKISDLEVAAYLAATATNTHRHSQTITRGICRGILTGAR